MPRCSCSAAKAPQTAGGKPARVSLTLGDRVIDEWDVPPGGRFFKRIVLEPGTLAGDGPFTRLVASYKGADGRPERVRLTQLMVASPQSVFHHRALGLERIGIQRSDCSADGDGRRRARRRSSTRPAAISR